MEKEKAQYIMVFGERGPGKTYCAKKLALEQFIESGYQTQSVYIRRWDLDLKMSKGAEFFDDIVKNDLVNDYQGNTFIHNEKSFIHLEETSYSLSMSEDYVNLLENYLTLRSEEVM